MKNCQKTIVAAALTGTAAVNLQGVNADLVSDLRETLFDVFTAPGGHGKEWSSLSECCGEEEDAGKLWMEFKEKYNRTYKDDAEENMRKAIFLRNEKKIAAHNADPKKYDFHSPLSPFADWTDKEFQSYNRLRVTGKTREWHSEKMAAHAPKLMEMVKDVKLQDSFDWRQKGGVNKVKDQGQCGSCWSFATVANIEGVHFKHKGALVSLSEQQLVDCDPEDHGCDGGLPQNADDYLITRHIGLETETEYPYNGEADQQCREDPSKEKIFVSQILHISQDEDDMARQLMNHGPLAIGINASPMQFYTGGVSMPSVDSCDPEALNHGVAIVGFGVEQSAALEKLWLLHQHSTRHERARKISDGKFQLVDKKAEKALFYQENQHLIAADEKDSATKYWIIRNSWGPSWGEQGYYRIVRGTGACGLNSLVTTAEGVTQRDGVSPVPEIFI